MYEHGVHTFIWYPKTCINLLVLKSFYCKINKWPLYLSLIYFILVKGLVIPCFILKFLCIDLIFP